jgi:hypothetical protein
MPLQKSLLPWYISKMPRGSNDVQRGIVDVEQGIDEVDWGIADVERGIFVVDQGPFRSGEGTDEMSHAALPGHNEASARPFKEETMNRKLTRALLLSLALCLTGLALVPRPAAAFDECFDPDQYEWREDGCCTNGFTNFRLWQCDGAHWYGTTTFKCGAPPYC